MVGKNIHCLTNGSHQCRPGHSYECRPNWHTTNTPGYLDIDLGDNDIIFDEIAISWSGFWGAGTKQWRVSVWNENNKSKHYQIKKSINSEHVRNRKDIINTIPIKAKHVRIWIDQRGASAICEIEIFNKQSTYPIHQVLSALEKHVDNMDIATIISEFLCCKHLSNVTKSLQFLAFDA